MINNSQKPSLRTKILSAGGIHLFLARALSDADAASTFKHRAHAAEKVKVCAATIDECTRIAVGLSAFEDRINANPTEQALLDVWSAYTQLASYYDMERSAVESVRTEANRFKEQGETMIKDAEKRVAEIRQSILDAGHSLCEDCGTNAAMPEHFCPYACMDGEPDESDSDYSDYRCTTCETCTGERGDNI